MDTEEVKQRKITQSEVIQFIDNLNKENLELLKKLIERQIEIVELRKYIQKLN